jgi:hypothetical protein
MARWRAFGIGLIGAIVGTVLVLAAWHGWSDHLAFHQLLTFINSVAPKLAALP